MMNTLPTGRTSLLEIAIRGAFVDALAQRTHATSAEDLTLVLEETRSIVTSAFDRISCSIARSFNERAPVSKLPLELLCYVAEHLPLRTLIRATHVCYVWRARLLASASAWRLVSSYKGLRTKGLSAIVQRSGAADLMLDIEATYSNWADVAAILESALFRCSSLMLTFDVKLPDQASERITSALRLPAPRLKSLKLYDCQANFDFSGIDAPLFNGVIAGLELVKLHTDMTALRASQSFLTVKRLLWCTTGSMHVELLLNILSLFPNLQSLGVEIDEWDPFQQTVDSSGLPRVQLPHQLEELVVISNPEELSPVDLLACVDHQGLKRLRAKFKTPPAVVTALGLIQHVTPRAPVLVLSVSGLVDCDDDVDIAFWSGEGDGKQMRRVYNIPRAALHAHPFFATLRHLHLNETSFARGEWLQAPELDHLTIQLLYGTLQGRHGADGVFMMSRTPERVFACLALCTLELSAATTAEVQTGGYHTYLPPALVLEFINLHLRFDAPRLEKLKLKGVRLLESNVVDVCALLSRVEVVEWSPGSARASTHSSTLLSWE